MVAYLFIGEKTIRLSLTRMYSLIRTTAFYLKIFFEKMKIHLINGLGWIVGLSLIVRRRDLGLLGNALREGFSIGS